MIVILYQSSCLKISEKIASDLAKAFNDHVVIMLLDAASASSWPAEISWDDLLIVIYNEDTFPDVGNAFIENYLQKRPQSAMLLPVAADPASRKPPKAAETIKALGYDHAAEGVSGRLANRAGGMLGLRVLGRDSKIFISYRATDGKAIANQLHAHLKSLGHNPFLDEAREVDDETTILPGNSVQKQIDEALSATNLVLLIDTPDAPASAWIRHEVDTADAMLLPILPLCFRDIGDKKEGPRFRSLLSLQRWVSLHKPSVSANPTLTDDQLDQIVSEAEEYLCEIFKRKCRVPFLVEKVFTSYGFNWGVLNKSLLMFQSLKNHSARLQIKVLSHCSVFDQIYDPAVKRFGTFIKDTGRFNYSLFIYDGEILSPLELQQINHVEDITILHHQELTALVSSNFTKLGLAA